MGEVFWVMQCVVLCDDGVLVVIDDCCCFFVECIEYVNYVGDQMSDFVVVYFGWCIGIVVVVYVGCDDVVVSCCEVGELMML